MLLVRLAFWIAIVAFLLPTAPDTQGPDTQGMAAAFGATSQEPRMDAQQAVALAVAAGSDVAGFCSRNPDVCALAREAGGHIVRQVTFYGAAAVDWVSETARTQGGSTRSAPPGQGI